MLNTTTVKTSLTGLCLGLCLCICAQETHFIHPLAAAPERQFDFWEGVWSVNLRIKNNDEWVDSIRSTAHIYKILGGKAIMELWDSDPIKGFSLRYYDPEQQKWQLWLNWPGPNNSRWSSLSGAFRHGRGAFFSQFVMQGDTIQSRYTFSDISPNSLRWDDAYSKDGGKTWSANWIMEFSRLQDQPAWPAGSEKMPTYSDGKRCTDPAFDYFDFLEGLKTAKLFMRGREVTESAFKVRSIVDGCARIFLLDGDEKQWFVMATYHSARSVPALYVLGSAADDKMENYFWDPKEEAFLTDAGQQKISPDPEGNIFSFQERTEGRWSEVYRLELE